MNTSTKSYSAFNIKSNRQIKNEVRDESIENGSNETNVDVLKRLLAQYRLELADKLKVNMSRQHTRLYPVTFASFVSP